MKYMENKKVLVTGGAGFIGSNLVDGLIEKGYEVAVIDNLSTGKREYLNEQAKFFEIDIIDQEKIQEIFEQEKFDYVFHLAAQISVSDSVKDPLFDNRVNAQGSFHIFDASSKTAVKKVLFVSTAGLYGDLVQPGNEELNVKPLSPYTIHKFTAERYLELFRIEHGLKSVVLRLANVFGPRQFKGGEGAVVAVFTNNAMHDLPSTIFGDGSKTRDLIYVGDVVGACLKAISSDYQGVVNIGTGQRISILELFRTIERISGKKLELNFADDRPGEVRDSILDINRAQEVLDWQPLTDLEEGIRRTLDASK